MKSLIRLPKLVKLTPRAALDVQGARKVTAAPSSGSRLVPRRAWSQDVATESQASDVLSV